jgi:hypothetical protein
MSAMIVYSTLTCPACGTPSRERMPEDACLFFRPKAGDCCVFCSYGSVPCPPKQQEKDCCT